MVKTKKPQGKEKNKSKNKNRIGPPFLFESADQIYSLANTYFQKCDNNLAPYTITGLAIALGTNRETLIDYANQGHSQPKELSDAIKAVKEKVVESVELRLFSTTPTGAIFWLKNHGWKDNQGIENSGSIDVNQTVEHSASKATIEALANAVIKAKAGVLK